MERIKMKLLGLILGLVSCLAFCGCMSPEPIDDMGQGKAISVKFSLKSEGDAVYTKGDGDDLCAISIYCLSGKTYSRYAYGLFKVSDVGSVDLLDNQKYKIECSIVKGGVSGIGRDSKGRYYEPFVVSSASCGLTSGFIQSSSVGFTNLYKGLAAVADDSYIGFTRCARPSIDRYSALLVDFTPKPQSSIELYAKRMVFGIKPSVDGFEDGVIEIELDGAPIISVTPSEEPVEHLFSLSGNPSNIYSVIEDNYTENVNLVVRWLRSNGSAITITPPGGQPITVQRRYSYPLAIKLQDTPQSSTITLEAPTLNIADSIVISM